MKAKGTIFAVVYRRIVPRLGHAQAIGAITHRLCRLIWKIQHERVRYEERGQPRQGFTRLPRLDPGAAASPWADNRSRTAPQFY